MKHAFIDTYAHLDTRVHRAHPVFKLLVLIIFLFVMVMTPVTAWPLMSGYALSVGILFWLSRIPARFFLKRLFHLLPFVFIISLSALFSAQGPRLFMNCLMKGIIAVAASLILSTTTPFQDMIHALKKLHIPSIFIHLLSFMYRYTFLLEDQILVTKRAMDSRNPRKKRALPGVKVAGNIVGSLFVRTYERAERVYLAMCARGYDYEKVTRDQRP